MKRRLFVSVLLSLFFATTWAADGDVFTAQTVEGIEMTFKVISESAKTCEVNGNMSTTAVDKATSGTVTIPAMANGYQVTSISEYAFFMCSDITNFVVPASVTEIGTGAFSSTGWYYAQPEGAIYVNNVLYKYKYNRYPCPITSFDVREGTVSITGETFLTCTNLASISFPEGLQSIGPNNFQGDHALKSVVLPQSLKKLGQWAFYNCSNLSSVTYYSNLEEVGYDAFKSTAWLNNQPNGMVYINDIAYKMKGNSTSVTLRSGTKKIAGYAFYESKVQRVTIPESVESIGSYAFGSSSLTAITIPSTVKEIKDATFYYCNNLKSVTLPENLKTITKSMFMSCQNLTSIEIPDNVTTIDDNAFSWCTALKTVKLPANLKTIGKYAFSVCYTLEDITLPNGVKTIDNGAFEGCSMLSGRLDIPSTVTTIGEIAYLGCHFTSLNIPSSVQQIGLRAFGSIPTLESITVSAANTVYDSRNGCQALIETATNTLMTGCRNTIIPSDVAVIGESAFNGCTALERVTLPEGLQRIEDDAFSQCTGLVEAFPLPSGLTHIGQRAFASCSSLTGELVLPTHLDSIEAGIFMECKQITGTIVIPEGVNSIGEYAFNGCEGLTGQVIIPLSVQALGYSAFSGCKGLTGSIVLPEGINEIPSSAFYNCSGITEITIPSTVEKIGSSAFGGCPLTTLVIPASITSMEKYAFSCPTLQRVVFEGDVPDGYGLFYGVGTAEQPALLIVTADYYANFEAAFNNGKFMDGYFTLAKAEDTQPTVDVYADLKDMIKALFEQAIRCANTYADLKRRNEIVKSEEIAAMLAVYKDYAANMPRQIEINALLNKLSMSFSNYETLYVQLQQVKGILDKVEANLAEIDALLRQLEQPTGVAAVGMKSDASAPIYDLQGRRVTAPARNVIYIQNGRKVVLKK